MGACATKPKVKTSDGTGREAPAPVPQPVKDEPATGSEGGVVAPDDHEGKEKKEVVVVSDEADDEKKKVVEGDEDHNHGGAAADDDQIKEVVDDEQASKRRSLSHLFKENEDGKDSTEKNEKRPSDEGAIMKLEPLASESEDLTADESKSSKVPAPAPAPEVKDSETVVEEIIPATIEVNNSTTAPEEKTKTEEVIEAAPADSETYDDKVTTLLEKYRGEKELENRNIETAPASEATHDDKVKIILEKFREEEEQNTTVDVKENNQENAK